MARPSDEAPARARFDRLDALRGAAIVWMVVFHFGFDLAHYRLIDADFYRDRFWLVQRTLIVSLFLLCAGIGQAVAARQGQRWPRFWRRWAQVAGCAALVSAGSALMFPQSWISFGVLHGMAVMLIAARIVAPWALRPGGWRLVVLLAAGIVAVLLPSFVQHAFFDTRATNWLGLVTRKPRTEDWVPVLPWLGVMLWGVAAGAWALKRRPGLLAGAIGRPLQPLAMLGRWSLSVYMLHQPVLIGAILGGIALIGR
ncbi:MAG TPA: heparan-alpha-glucosaminide N-acetyltransferase [Methylibium sp.]|uniref:heparan-alpha-glucosaminide N-acetyltransferase n=1 Tax=Methylibium sp. TaxID=2067992 RepID=UPI002DBFF946|nr:heparan-alpha-glucosaminide N-acetyltransferase [Methylibium sp.]HEU4459730.1 heparan-alpha-glucosaminide N-acetyltransferase [Methylibium sp.]